MQVKRIHIYILLYICKSRNMISVARRAPQIIFRASPYIAMMAAGYAYNLHDNRDLNAAEIIKAHRSLERLDGRKTGRKQKTDVNTDSLQSIVVRQHLKNLKSSGATVIRSVLTPNEAAQWVSSISRKIADDDGTCIVPAGGAIGRIHCRLVKRNRRSGRNGGDGLYELLAQIPYAPINSNDNTDMQRSASVDIRLNDIAREYFALHGIHEGQYELSQPQLLDASPKSTNQIWHRDNVRPGLTVIIALRDVGPNGPTEMLLRSHQGSLMAVLSNRNAKGDELGFQRLLLASINRGDAICYDARILHRGRGYGNCSSGEKEVFEHRPVLVIRWDAKLTPAPGTGFIGTQLSKYEGASLALVASLLDWFAKQRGKYQ